MQCKQEGVVSSCLEQKIMAMLFLSHQNVEAKQSGCCYALVGIKNRIVLILN